MAGLINKMKDKLHIGKDKDEDVAVATSTAGPRPGGTQVATQHATTGAGAAAHSATAPSAQQSRATQGQTTHSTHGAHGQTAESGVTGQSVTVHEHDPNWQRARDLTTGAEHASKVSAAKAYEAESNLVSAQDAHRLAQDATTRHAHLLAQAEAEKQNIGGADYVHKELDQYKNKIEEKEKIHIDLNKNLDSSRQLVAAKESELGSVAPVVQQHQKEIDNLSNKLGSLQGAKGDLQNKHDTYAASLSKLQSQQTQYADEVARLEAEVEKLNLHANELEEQARAARASANDRLKRLQGAKSAHKDIGGELSKVSTGLAGVKKDLDGYNAKEADLSQRLTATQAAAKDAADLAAAKEAELQLARQQLQAEEVKGQPVAQDIERYRKEVHNKEREYEEALVSSKAAKAAYDKFSREAAQAKEVALGHTSTKDAKYAKYQELKSEAQAAKDRENELWEEAKKHGNTGDVNALQRLAEAEKALTASQKDISQPIVVPDVGPKQPTTEGPKLHKKERATEDHDTESRENVQTHY